MSTDESHLEVFPDPVEAPPHVEEARDDRLANLRRLVVIGLSVRGLVVMAELAAWWQLGSETLLVDAVASLLDIGSSLALLVAVLMATRPPDEDHPFGHGRYEPLAGLQLGLLIAGAGVWLAMRGAKPSPMGDADWIFLIPLAATALLTATGWRMRVVARLENIIFRSCYRL